MLGLWPRTLVTTLVSQSQEKIHSFTLSNSQLANPEWRGKTEWFHVAAGVTFVPVTFCFLFTSGSIDGFLSII
jgi:hypothetical protein